MKTWSRLACVGVCMCEPTCEYATLINTSVIERKGEVLYETVSRQHPPPPLEDGEDEVGEGEDPLDGLVVMQDEGGEVEVDVEGVVNVDEDDDDDDDEDTTIRA
eukprot:sb/3478126/